MTGCVLQQHLIPLICASHTYSLTSSLQSNAKDIWANAHPMTSEELITAQAEAVYAADPGVPGSMPRVWAYRVSASYARFAPFYPFLTPQKPLISPRIR
jgi:hypothetical protein